MGEFCSDLHDEASHNANLVVNPAMSINANGVTASAVLVYTDKLTVDTATLINAGAVG